MDDEWEDSNWESSLTREDWRRINDYAMENKIWRMARGSRWERIKLKLWRVYWWLTWCDYYDWGPR